MADDLLKGLEVPIDPALGAVTMTLKGNANTFLRARGAWRLRNTQVDRLTGELEDGQAFVVPASNPADLAGSLLCFALRAAAFDSRDRHLFVTLKIFQAGSPNLIKAHDYRFDLPKGFNAWELSDGVTLRV